MKVEVKSTFTVDQECCKLLEDALRVYLGALTGACLKPLLPALGRDKKTLANNSREFLRALAANNIPIDPGTDLVAHAEHEAAKATEEQAAEPPPATSEAEPKKNSKSRSKAAPPPPAEEPKAGESETAQEAPPQEIPPPPECPHCGANRSKHKAKAPRGHVWQCQAPGCKMQFLTPHEKPDESTPPPQTEGEELVERRTAFCKKCGDELELIGYDNEDDQTGIWSCAACGDGNIRHSRWIPAAEAEQATA